MMPETPALFRYYQHKLKEHVAALEAAAQRYLDAAEAVRGADGQLPELLAGPDLLPLIEATEELHAQLLRGLELGELGRMAIAMLEDPTGDAGDATYQA